MLVPTEQVHPEGRRRAGPGGCLASSSVSRTPRREQGMGTGAQRWRGSAVMPGWVPACNNRGSAPRPQAGGGWETQAPSRSPATAYAIVHSTRRRRVSYLVGPWPCGEILTVSTV